MDIGSACKTCTGDRSGMNSRPANAVRASLPRHEWPGLTRNQIKPSLHCRPTTLRKTRIVRI